MQILRPTLIFHFIMIFSFFLPLESIGSQRINPTTDLVYLGAFRIPLGDGRAMTYYPKGDPNGEKDGFPGSLYVVADTCNGLVSEISIPAPIKSSLDNVMDLPVAVKLQNETDITDGQIEKGCLTNPDMGVMQYLPKQDQQGQDKLYWVTYIYYIS